MNIAFVLPRDKNKAIGGFKVVYEYANRLVKRGHNITILYNNVSTLEHYRLPLWLKHGLISFRTDLYPKWFDLDPAVKKISYFGGQYDKETFDAVFATSVGSVKPTKEAFPEGNLFYLIQDYENWGVDEDYVKATYKMGMHNVVVSKWLKGIVQEIAGDEPVLLSNPIDLDVYKQIIPPQKRDPFSVGLLYHKNANKGLKYSFKALHDLKKKYPSLSVKMFGTSRIKEHLPGWIKYTRNASTAQTVSIYNSVAVFMCSSTDEGFGLTGMEAMACGAALASTDYTGVKEYAIDGYNALLSPVKDIDGMVRNVSRLIEDKQLREYMSSNAKNILMDRTWDHNVSMLELIIKQSIR